MHLKSISLKGFKSFSERRRLEFAPGVSVIVGPNGSGKSNITDALVWALGEQSPAQVRAQAMNDVIFSGGHGVRGRKEAEVEVVFDNSDGTLGTDFSEVSIQRRIDRSGQGEYRLNGARCRMVDILEVLSDTNLGKEMHSVVSQGQVESVVHSKPLERRRLVEEAAGLGKHRKRRRRAELKLAKAHDHLDRVRDVEREARTRLRPLKRQAEAAEIHARIDRQLLELDGRIAAEDLRAFELDASRTDAEARRAEEVRSRAEKSLADLAERREKTELSAARYAREREAAMAALYGVKRSRDRLILVRERMFDSTVSSEATIQECRARMAELEADLKSEVQGDDYAAGLEELESKLAEARAEVEARREEAVAELAAQRKRAEELAGEIQERLRREEAQAREAVSAAQDARRAAKDRASERDLGHRAAIKAKHDLESVEERIKSGVGLGEQARALARAGADLVGGSIDVQEGYDKAVAAVLGDRLSAGIVPDFGAGIRLLDLVGEGAGVVVRGRTRTLSGGGPPCSGAEPLSARLSVDPAVAAEVEPLLADAWIVDRLEDVRSDFEGTAVTRQGVSWSGRLGELKRPLGSGRDRLSADRRRLKGLREEVERTAHTLVELEAAVHVAEQEVPRAELRREKSESDLRALRRELDEAREAADRAGWLSEQRRLRVGEGPEAARLAELEAEAKVFKATAERSKVERERKRRDVGRMSCRLADEERRLPLARELLAVVERAVEVSAGRLEHFQSRANRDLADGDRTGNELKALAQAEYKSRAELHEAGERLTQCRVAASQAEGKRSEAAARLDGIADRLGYITQPADEPLDDAARGEIERSSERLLNRREKLGPVNPLAKKEYEEAVAHADELRMQREDAEKALAELGRLIRETDRHIRDTFEATFEATARNFGGMVEKLFPGGRGNLRLVETEIARPEAKADEAESVEADREEGDSESVGDGLEPASDSAEDRTGVEIEITPKGKSMRKLSLLSGGEKSLVALAFLFSVFLARPCPFYVLDEVEAALDDANIDRFLSLLTQMSDRAQFIVVTHQKRTMDAADVVYGVSMAGDGVSNVVSRKLKKRSDEPAEDREISVMAQAA